ncbi:uncharacterized protein [Physcomitrium patens]|uniref:uncharacterized protein n=1 Tax=Physcomitrium patens TaxID=3218 RepID=UPI003CCCF02D
MLTSLLQCVAHCDSSGGMSEETIESERAIERERESSETYFSSSPCRRVASFCTVLRACCRCRSFSSTGRIGSSSHLPLVFQLDLAAPRAVEFCTFENRAATAFSLGLLCGSRTEAAKEGLGIREQNVFALYVLDTGYLT